MMKRIRYRIALYAFSLPRNTKVTVRLMYVEFIISAIWTFAEYQISG